MVSKRAVTFMLAGGFFAGCQQGGPPKATVSVPPVSESAVASVEESWRASHPGSQIGHVNAVDTSRRIASVAGLPASEIHPGDVLTILPGGQSTNTLQGIVYDRASGYVQLDYAPGQPGLSDPRIGDLVVWYPGGVTVAPPMDQTPALPPPTVGGTGTPPMTTPPGTAPEVTPAPGTPAPATPPLPAPTPAPETTTPAPVPPTTPPATPPATTPAPGTETPPAPPTPPATTPAPAPGAATETPTPPAASAPTPAPAPAPGAATDTPPAPAPAPPPTPGVATDTPPAPAPSPAPAPAPGAASTTETPTAPTPPAPDNKVPSDLNK